MMHCRRHHDGEVHMDKVKTGMNEVMGGGKEQVDVKWIKPGGGERR